jgi:hypothetical protein
MKTQLSTYPLRLPASIKAEAERLAALDGTSLNQFVAAAVAEKIGAMRTVDYFAARKGKGDSEAFRRFMARDGGEPPRSGDELPPEE